jgi:hypothetical protein
MPRRRNGKQLLASLNTIVKLEQAAYRASVNELLGDETNVTLAQR